jgi:hypothetical protein
MLLNSRQRSQLFSQLATPEHAGIAPAQAFAVVGRDLPSAARQTLAQTAADLAKGVEAVEKN